MSHTSGQKGCIYTCMCVCVRWCYVTLCNTNVRQWVVVEEVGGMRTGHWSSCNYTYTHTPHPAHTYMPHTHTHTHTYTHTLTHTHIYTHTHTHTHTHIQKVDSAAQRKKTDAPTPDDRGKSLHGVAWWDELYVICDTKYGITDNRAFHSQTISVKECPGRACDKESVLEVYLANLGLES